MSKANPSRDQNINFRNAKLEIKLGSLEENGVVKGWKVYFRFEINPELYPGGSKNYEEPNWRDLYPNE